MSDDNISIIKEYKILESKPKEPKIRCKELKRVAKNMKKHYDIEIPVKEEVNRKECIRKALSKYLFPDMVNEILGNINFDYTDLRENPPYWIFTGEIMKNNIRKFMDLLVGFYCEKIPNFRINGGYNQTIKPILLETENKESDMDLYLLATPLHITSLVFCDLMIDSPIIPLWICREKPLKYTYKLDDLEEGKTWLIENGLAFFPE